MPTLLLLNQFGVYDIYEQIPQWTWLCYIFLFNSVVLLFLAKYFIRTIPFPFSNRCYKNNAHRVTDRKFSQEFVTRIERMTLTIRELADRQSDEFALRSLTGS